MQIIHPNLIQSEIPEWKEEQLTQNVVWCIGTYLSDVSQWQNHVQNKKISNDQELIQSDPISCPQNQKENN